MRLGPRLRRRGCLLALGGFLVVVIAACWAFRHPLHVWVALHRGGWEPLNAPELEVFLEAPASPALQRECLDMVREARHRLEEGLGSVSARPQVLLCQTDPRFLASTGLDQVVEGVTLRSPFSTPIVLAAHGRRAVILAHEWTHAEIQQRVGFWASERRLPIWFQEGLCLLISGDHRFEPQDWQAEAARLGWRPNLDELQTPSAFARARNRSTIIAYGIAKQEVARWIAERGPLAPRTLLEAVAAGESFASAYVRIRTPKEPA